MTDFTIGRARYAKGKMVIVCRSDGSGMKTRAMCLASAKGIGGRWSNRCRGYVVSPSAAERFRKLYAEGWDASWWDGSLIPPRIAA